MSNEEISFSSDSVYYVDAVVMNNATHGVASVVYSVKRSEVGQLQQLRKQIESQQEDLVSLSRGNKTNSATEVLRGSTVVEDREKAILKLRMALNENYSTYNRLLGSPAGYLAQDYPRGSVIEKSGVEPRPIRRTQRA